MSTIKINPVYLKKSGSGTVLIAAAGLKIDSTPMEGSETAKFDGLLEPKYLGLNDVVTFVPGYRDVRNDVFEFKLIDH